jgi:hypothetical protein
MERYEGFLVGGVLFLLAGTLPAGLIAMAAGATIETVTGILVAGLVIAGAMTAWAAATFIHDYF